MTKAFNDPTVDCCERDAADCDCPKFVATINTPGYLPEGDEPAVFDTAAAAWDYLADERKRAEDDCPEWPSDNVGDYSETRINLAAIAAWLSAGKPGNVHPACINADGTGVMYGLTPGYEGNHDQGKAYSVSLVIDCEHDQTREKVTCGACGRSWCDRCNPTHGPRCAFEYDHPAGING